MSKAVPKEAKIAPALIISLYCNFIISEILLYYFWHLDVRVASFMNVHDYLARRYFMARDPHVDPDKQ
jgi:hypothetical protein